MSTEHLTEEQLAARALGESSPEDAAAVDSHVASCDACRRAAEALRDALATYREADREEPSRAVIGDLLAAQAAQTAPAAPGMRPVHARRPTRLALAAAAIVLLFLSGFWTGRRTAGGPGASEAAPGTTMDALPAAAPASVPTPEHARPLPEPPAVRFAAVPATRT